MKVKIIGAGFSGLTLAYFLTESGTKPKDIQIIEKSSSVGGLIQSHVMDGYLVETAANAILGNHELEKMCSRIGIQILPHLKSSKRRFIFVDGPKQFPLPWFHFFFVMIPFLLKFIFIRQGILPKRQETIPQWVRRNLSERFLNHLIAPGLQGVYGGNTENLSATLILKRILTRHKGPTRSQNPDLRGSVSFEKGLGEFLNKTADYLKQNQVQISLNQNYTADDLKTDLANKISVVLCVHAHAASKILKDYDTQISSQLKNLNYNDLVSVTVLTEMHTSSAKDKTIQGFGVLFPWDQKFNSLGVLFPNWIFQGRGPKQHETWILPSADRDSDELILNQIQSDRARLMNTLQTITTSHIYRWPEAIPSYDLNLELFLETWSQKKPVFLHGNYLGEIGLGKILCKSKALAEIIQAG
ncbi:MAG: protoporphyrinogen/coproporphyrinogen oxidase [Pseudobdellovibrionaceae bacterium]